MDIKTHIYSLLVIAFLFSGMPSFAEQFPAVVEAEERAVLSAEMEGALSVLNADVSDYVRKGNVLGVVFHRDLILKKEQYEATHKYLSVHLENLKRLSERGMVTEEELAKAEMDLAVNEKEMSIIQTQIDRSKILAPFSGIIVSRHTQPHEWVKPGQPVVELYDPNQLRLVTDIPSDFAVKLIKGQTKSIFFPDQNMEIQVKLSYFSPQVDVRSNTVKVFWEVVLSKAKDIELKPGMKGILKLGNA